MNDQQISRRRPRRPETLRLDWPAAFKIAMAVVVLSFFLKLLFWVLFGAGVAFLAVAAS